MYFKICLHIFPHFCEIWKQKRDLLKSFVCVHVYKFLFYFAVDISSTLLLLFPFFYAHFTPHASHTRTFKYILRLFLCVFVSVRGAGPNNFFSFYLHACMRACVCIVCMPRRATVKLWRSLIQRFDLSVVQHLLTIKVILQYSSLFLLLFSCIRTLYISFLSFASTPVRFKFIISFAFLPQIFFFSLKCTIL